MKLLGQRVYLELPKMKEYKVSITPELKKQMEDEYLQKLDKLKVFSTAVAEVNVGDEVFVDPNGLRRGVKIQLEDKELISVSAFDIMHIW